MSLKIPNPSSLRAVSLCSSESKSSGEVASELASPLDFGVSSTDSEEQKENARGPQSFSHYVVIVLTTE